VTATSTADQAACQVPATMGVAVEGPVADPPQGDFGSGLEPIGRSPGWRIVSGTMLSPPVPPTSHASRPSPWILNEAGVVDRKDRLSPKSSGASNSKSPSASRRA
jgi:hypothetical protein